MSNYLATDTDLTAVANAIRTKGGTSASLAFPTDFVSAIAAIPSGGTPTRTKWYCPPDWPDISGLELTPYTYNDFRAYYVIDTSQLPADKKILCNYLEFTVGHVTNNAYVVDYTATQISGNTYGLTLPNDCPRFVVAYYSKSGYSAGRGLMDSVSKYHLPVVEMRWAQGASSPPFTNYPSMEVMSIKNSNYSLSSNAIPYPSGNLKVLIFEGGLNISYKFSGLFGNRKALQKIYFNQSTQVTKTGIGDGTTFCTADVSLREFDMSWLTASGMTSMGSCFDYCSSLETLNLSNWDMTSATGFGNAFRQCYSLTNVILTDAVLPKLNISFADCNLLTDASLVNIANALFAGAAKTLTLHATPKASVSRIMGIVQNDKFTISELGTVTLMDFITNTKGWTVA